MNALLLVAHGSRRKESNSEVAVLAKHMNNLLDGEFDFVEHGFLELAEPYIPDAIDLCVHKGAEKLLSSPTSYLLVGMWRKMFQKRLIKVALTIQILKLKLLIILVRVKKLLIIGKISCIRSIWSK